jgi:anaerobic nitric oxide reductase flavorubredoxin
MDTMIANDVYWVGYVDWTVRDFHSYQTDRGTTYNAYLIRDEKTTLIDTVKSPYADELLRNVTELCQPAAVDYVVCNHAEPDHSGALPRVMEALPNVTLLCNKKCAAALGQHYDTSRWRVQLVTNGSSISLGRRTLRFLDTPMVHWPESMFTYVPEEKLLFSMDAFGQHYASSARFEDAASLSTVMGEAKTYYANIVLPYGKAVTACLGQTAALDIATIAPSHGVIWREHVGQILQSYRNWSAGRVEPKVLVIYDTMWESTTAMAEAVFDGAMAVNGTAGPRVEVELIHVRRSNPTQIAAEMLDAAAVALGSPTLNREMMPTMAAVLCYLKGLRPVGKAAFAFGSYGWGKGATEAVQQWIEDMSWDTVRPPLRAQYRPTPAVLEECRAAGKVLAERAIAVAGAE